MPEIKKANAGTSAGNNNNRKDRIISAQTALEILNAKFDHSGLLSKSELKQLLNGQFTINYPQFSYFKAPVTNTTPTKEIDLLQLYRAISGTHYKQLTELYRSMEAGATKANFKKSMFDFVCFAGSFSSRKVDGLKQLSGYCVLDFDHIESPEMLKTLLINDEILDVQLAFVSPSADGLKVVVFNNSSALYQVFYSALVNYIHKKYPTLKMSLDLKNKDIPRATFICFDPDCYIKPQYTELCLHLRNY